jgi:hypothetical protein
MTIAGLKAQAVGGENVEFSLEKLEYILMKEAERRGERFYRIIQRAQDEVLFARDRLCVDLGRIEKLFSVVRVSPEESGLSVFPERVVFHVTSKMSFEKAANAASFALNGAIDILELPFSAWETEKCRWQNELSASRPKGMDQRKMDIAKLVLSYKVLRFDMDRICLALPDRGGERARKRMEGFERRLETLDASSVMFLSFNAQGERYIMPRFLVSGYRWKDSGGELRRHLERERQCVAENPGIDPSRGKEAALERFGILANPAADTLAADRLVSYREIRLGDIKILERRSRLCFDVAAQGEPWRLVLPESALGEELSA